MKILKNRKKIDIVLKDKGITFYSSENWYLRLWILISNPFRYIFTGKIKI